MSSACLGKKRDEQGRGRDEFVRFGLFNVYVRSREQDVYRDFPHVSKQGKFQQRLFGVLKSGKDKVCRKLLRGFITTSLA